MTRIFPFLFIFLIAFPAQAQDKDPFSASGLPIPRFVSTASDMVFVRSGPALRYPIKWILQKEGLPVEVVQEFDTWRKIRDADGEEGWVHQSLLKGRRTVLVKADKPVELFKKPEDGARMMARVEPGVVAALEGCEGQWCQIKAEGFSGWLTRPLLWGVYENESVE